MIKVSKLNGIKFVTNTLNVSVFSYIQPVGNAIDGVVTLAVTGGRYPYLYSKDNGVTFQTSNVFTGIGVGIYYFMVKDQFNFLGWTSVKIASNVDCGLYSGALLSEVITDNIKLENVLNCLLSDFI